MRQCLKGFESGISLVQNPGHHPLSGPGAIALEKEFPDGQFVMALRLGPTKSKRSGGFEPTPEDHHSAGDVANQQQRRVIDDERRRLRGIRLACRLSGG